VEASDRKAQTLKYFNRSILLNAIPGGVHLLCICVVRLVAPVEQLQRTSISELLNDTPQGCQRLVDVCTLLELTTLNVGIASSLTARQVYKFELSNNIWCHASLCSAPGNLEWQPSITCKQWCIAIYGARRGLMVRLHTKQAALVIKCSHAMCSAKL
jgi:hypothetical protein